MDRGGLILISTNCSAISVLCAAGGTDFMQSAVVWTDWVTAAATALGAAATVGTLIFFGRQLRFQSEALKDQRLATAETLRLMSAQIEAQTRQAEIEAAAAELTVNLGVMARLQEVLYEISDHEESRKHIWGNPPEADMPDGTRPGLGVWAMLDVMSIALTASERLPGFSRNATEDWIQYSLDSLHQSPSLREELGQDWGTTYWPELHFVLEAYNAGIRTHADYSQWFKRRA
jgi:hypothetical protein